MNRIIKARAHLESIQPGLFASLIQQTIEQNGIVHVEPSCFLLACFKDNSTLHITYACADLFHLRSLLDTTGATTIEWKRDFARGQSYGTHSVSLSDLHRHHSFGIPS